MHVQPYTIESFADTKVHMTGLKLNRNEEVAFPCG